MPKVELINDERIISLNDGENLLQASLNAGIQHACACGGNAFCSTCRVFIEEGMESVPARNGKEEALSSKLGLIPEVRLACQLIPTGDIKVRRLVLDEIDRQIIKSSGTSEKPRSLGIEKEASVLFVDIADYTAFAEKTPAYDVVHVLNRYYYIAGSIIKTHHGQIVDYYGDGFLAIFGLDENTNHAANLIKAGFDLQDAIDRFDHDIHSLVNKDFKIRLGAHTGKIIWGTIGIEGMQKQAAIGDTVNFASRIEQANKDLNTNFLISENLYKQFDKWCTACSQHTIKAKGKSGEYKVYAIDRKREDAPIESDN